MSISLYSIMKREKSGVKSGALIFLLGITMHNNSYNKMNHIVENGKIMGIDLYKQYLIF